MSSVQQLSHLQLRSQSVTQTITRSFSLDSKLSSTMALADIKIKLEKKISLALETKDENLLQEVKMLQKA